MPLNVVVIYYIFSFISGKYTVFFTFAQHLHYTYIDELFKIMEEKEFN